MKTLLVIALLFAAMCVTSPTASAQNQGVQATVPFNFSFGPSHLAAGTYILTATNSSHFINIRNKGNGTGVIALAMPVERGGPRHVPNSSSTSTATSTSFRKFVAKYAP